MASILSSGGAVFGWSSPEHRIVCEIAWLTLSDDGRAFVREVRASDPEPSRKFRDSCMWADKVRHTTHRATDTYHYFDVARTYVGIEQERDCPGHDCAPAAIERFSRRLSLPAETAAETRRRAEALKFLAHFVADLHQPLHVGRPEDRGGNRIEVVWFGERTEEGRPITLHQVWDRRIGRRAGLNGPGSATNLMRDFADELSAARAGTDPWAWALESRVLADQVAYELPDDLALDEAYFARALPVVRRQLWLAGVRLAALIEKSAPTPSERRRLAPPPG